MNHRLLLISYTFLLTSLAAVTAAYMSLRLGYYLGGSIMAGVLGSSLALFTRKESLSSANYIQTAASAAGSIAGLVIIQQASYWLSGQFISTEKLFLLLLFAAFFGNQIGVLFTPIFIDTWNLKYPSGNAVAALLKELMNTDRLKQSIRKIFLAFTSSFSLPYLIANHHIVVIASFSLATVGAGIIAGFTIAVPALLMSIIGEVLLVDIWQDAGWLNPGEPFQKGGFLFGLALIASSAIVQLIELVYQSGTSRKQEKNRASVPNYALSLFAALGLALVLLLSFEIPLWNVLLILLFSIFFICINGIATGVSDFNPISSAFLITVVISQIFFPINTSMALIAGSVVLIATSIGVDMQQDLATGKLLNSNRKHQRYFQLLGIVAGSLLCISLAQAFFSEFPSLLAGEVSSNWQSAMTVKVVTAVQMQDASEGFFMIIMAGAITGIVLRLLRVYVFQIKKWKGTWLEILIPSPFALSFGAFVRWEYTMWFAVGGIVHFILLKKSSTTENAERYASFIGAGFIAGEAINFLFRLF